MRRFWWKGIPRTRLDQVAEVGPSWSEVLNHVLPNRTKLWKTIRLLVFSAGIGLPAAIFLAQMTMDRDARLARERFEQAELKRQQALDLKKTYEARASAAAASWKAWEEAFVGPTQSAVCYHSHRVTETRDVKYTITCYTGPKGASPPSTIVACVPGGCAIFK